MTIIIEPSDSNIVSSPQGDEMSLAKVVSAFLPYIEKRVSGLQLPGLDRDDLRQEAFVALFAAIGSYDADKGAGFSTYAISCINNRLADVAKSAFRQKNKPLNEYVSLFDELNGAQIPTSDIALEDMAIIKEEYQAVQQRIDGLLTGLERETLSLWIEGYDYNEIAARLGKSSKSVGNALQRARKKLKQ